MRYRYWLELNLVFVDVQNGHQAHAEYDAEHLDAGDTQLFDERIAWLLELTIHLWQLNIIQTTWNQQLKNGKKHERLAYENS